MTRPLDLRERLRLSVAVANDDIRTPSLERCDYCGCSRHACGCEARFEYEDIRDNPELFAR